ncbi:glycosyltransferase family 47 protein, partial [Porticoccaceae bacterium]|nr:glycosyltransferase family 47 protein [Porticoccaceae bacterium]
SLEGFDPQPINVNERAYDWSWMGQFDPYTRVNFRNAVVNLETRGHASEVLWYEGWNNGNPMEDYSNVMANTRIALVPNGSASYESFRFFEAAMAGCVIVSQQMPVTSMYNVAPTITVDNNWSNLPNVIDMILQNPEEMEYYSEAGKAWYKYFCSPEGLAYYMRKRLK